MAALACAAVVGLPLGPAVAATREAMPKATPSTLPPTKAWVLVDVDTGNVLAGSNDRTPLPPASLTKVITALAAVAVAPTTLVKVSAAAADAPADKVGLRVGQVWTADELFHALLISSANDAAVALAEQVGGSLSGFQVDFARTARELGLADSPILMDPAGLDGSEGVNGGNRVSARDLAIAGRALLADPYLASIVADRTYDFEDPGNIAHHLVSHNISFLLSYPGAIGIKTGFTDRAGTCLMAAARRDGRTMLAVVLDSANPGAAATALLNQGFATPVAAETTAGRLPTVDLAALDPPAPGAPATTRPRPAAATRGSDDPRGISDGPPAGADVAALGSHSGSGSFTMLTVDGVVAFLLCLATLARIRFEGRRRASGPSPEPRRRPGPASDSDDARF